MPEVRTESLPNCKKSIKSDTNTYPILRSPKHAWYLESISDNFNRGECEPATNSIRIKSSESKPNRKKSSTVDFHSYFESTKCDFSNVKSESILNIPQLNINDQILIRNLDLLLTETNAKKLNNKINFLLQGGRFREATGIIFDFCDEYLASGNFDLISTSIELLPMNNYPGKILIAFLSITNPWKTVRSLTKVRTRLFELAYEKLTHEVGIDRTQNILAGLK